VWPSGGAPFGYIPFDPEDDDGEESSVKQDLGAELSAPALPALRDRA
jgi:hypothetical protein